MIEREHHYITKKTREFLIVNSRFLIQNFLNQLLWYTDIKESYFLVTQISETLDLNSLEKSDDLAIAFHVLIDFKTKKEISWRPFAGSSTVKTNAVKVHIKSFCVCLLKKRINNCCKFT